MMDYLPTESLTFLENGTEILTSTVAMKWETNGKTIQKAKVGFVGYYHVSVILIHNVLFYL